MVSSFMVVNFSFRAGFKSCYRYSTVTFFPFSLFRFSQSGTGFQSVGKVNGFVVVVVTLVPWKIFDWDIIQKLIHRSIASGFLVVSGALPSSRYGRIECVRMAQSAVGPGSQLMRCRPRHCCCAFTVLTKRPFCCCCFVSVPKR